VQRLADLGGVRVRRTPRADSTALGAAMQAGLAAGAWPDVDAIPPIPEDLVAEPRLADREAERERWAEAAALARGPAAP
jgi:glycerol kinase